MNILPVAIRDIKLREFWSPQHFIFQFKVLNFVNRKLFVKVGHRSRLLPERVVRAGCCTAIAANMNLFSSENTLSDTLCILSLALFFKDVEGRNVLLGELAAWSLFEH
jgi:hypothetical protein